MNFTKMILPVNSSRKKAKLRFFLAYAISIGLVLVIFSSFLRPAAKTETSAIPLSGRDTDFHSDIYRYLHQRMEAVETVSATVTANRNTKNLSLLAAEEKRFQKTIDSIRRNLVSRPNAKNENELMVLLDAFSESARKQAGLARGQAPAPDLAKQSALLNEQVMETQKQLADLENRNELLLAENTALKETLEENPAPSTAVSQPVVSNNGAEWKARYESMRAANDRLQETNSRYESQINSLKKTYKEVVDDNRRLLTQLQAARAGRN